MPRSISLNIILVKLDRDFVDLRGVKTLIRLYQILVSLIIFFVLYILEDDLLREEEELAENIESPDQPVYDREQLLTLYKVGKYSKIKIAVSHRKISCQQGVSESKSG